jgi:hypothetical protein
VSIGNLYWHLLQKEFTMQTSQPQQYFHLATPQQVLALPLVAGDTLQVTQGSIWLTLEGHSRDVWLKAEDCWTMPVGARVWISADATAAAAFVVRKPAMRQVSAVSPVGATPRWRAAAAA